MFRSNMWALKNKLTGKLVSSFEAMCLDFGEGHDFPMVFYNRHAARMNRKENYSVVKVAVNIRKAA